MKRIILFCFLTYVINIFAQTSDRRDGNYWNILPENDKFNYVTGFFDGVDLGHSFSIWGLDSSKIYCAIDVLNSYNGYVDKYLLHL